MAKPIVVRVEIKGPPTFLCDCCGKEFPREYMHNETLCRDCRREYGELADIFGMDEAMVRSNLE